MDRSSEQQTTYNYVDWLTSVPWGRTTAPSFEVDSTREILDRDHFGMEVVKKRISEFVAVSKLNRGSTSKILCFVGPPGVGKTSIGKSIAEVRFSLGCVFDCHWQTYDFCYHDMPSLAKLREIGDMPCDSIQVLIFRLARVSQR
jgi:ATP-dependent Lon protease